MPIRKARALIKRPRTGFTRLTQSPIKRALQSKAAGKLRAAGTKASFRAKRAGRRVAASKVGVKARAAGAYAAGTRAGKHVIKHKRKYAVGGAAAGGYAVGRRRKRRTRR